MRRHSLSNLLANCGLLAAGLLVYHLILRLFMSEYGLRLGAISAKLAPLYAYWRPHVKGWLIIPVAALVSYFWFLRRTRVATSLSDRVAIVAFTFFFIAIAISVAMLDGGPRSIITPLLRTDLEYTGAIDRVQGIGQFLRDYPSQASSMPMHAQVHPPGAVLFVAAASRLLGGGPWSVATGIIGFSALTVSIVYLCANRLGGPGVARRATALFVLTPSVVLFTATSMDGPFAVFLIATMWLFWESLHSRPVFHGSIAGLAAAGAALMTYSVTVALLFCGLATCVGWFILPERRRQILQAAASATVTFIVFHLLLWLTTGYDPIAMFLAAVRNSNHIMTGTRHESAFRYVNITLANLIVFFIAAGLPCTALWWPTIVRQLFKKNTGTVPATCNSNHAINIASFASFSNQQSAIINSPSSIHFAVTALLTLFISASVPVYVLEVERVWLFLTPLVAIPVAGQLFDQERRSGSIATTLAVAALLAAQTLLTEVLLTTYW